MPSQGTPASSYNPWATNGSQSSFNTSPDLRVRRPVFVTGKRLILNLSMVLKPTHGPRILKIHAGARMTRCCVRTLTSYSRVCRWEWDRPPTALIRPNNRPSCPPIILFSTMVNLMMEAITEVPLPRKAVLCFHGTSHIPGNSLPLGFATHQAHFQFVRVLPAVHFLIYHACILLVKTAWHILLSFIRAQVGPGVNMQ